MDLLFLWSSGITGEESVIFPTLGMKNPTKNSSPELFKTRRERVMRSFFFERRATLSLLKVGKKRKDAFRMSSLLDI